MSKYLKQLGLLLGLIIVAITVKSMMLQGIDTVRLAKAPPLTNAVSESLDTNDLADVPPIAGVDYTLKDTHYFYDKEWVVTQVSPLQDNADTVYVVLQKIDGIYQVVVGPATIFSVSYNYSLPANVVNFLNLRGLINGS